VFALAALALLTPSSTRAWSTRVNYLTFNTAVRLPGALLTPGTYTFEAGPQGNDLDVVRVSNRRGDKVLFQGFTIAVSRPAAGPTVSLGEAPQGAPQPIIVWYENGAKTGHRFQYQ
jgi:hypothetical protein